MPLSVSQYSSPDTKPFNLELHLTYANSHCLSLCCWFKGTVHHNIDIFPLTCSAIYSSRLFELPIDVRLVALKGPKDISKNLNSNVSFQKILKIIHRPCWELFHVGAFYPSFQQPSMAHADEAAATFKLCYIMMAL